MQPKFLAGKSILVADDETFGRKIVLRNLRDYGDPKLEEARNGAEALAILADPGKRCDAVIVDFSMPTVNGLTVLKSIRIGFNDIRRDLPVLMLTGNSDAELVSSAILLDVDAFVVKPVSKVDLATRLHKALTIKREVRSPLHYSKIPTELLENSAPNSASVPIPKEIEIDTGEGTSISINAVQADSVLARDLKNGGATVLAAGTRLTHHYVLRLRELAAADPTLHTVWVL